MISWNLLLLPACLLLLYLLYKEWQRKRRRHLFMRLALSVLAIAALLLMAYPYTAKHTGAQKLAVLTEGFVKDSVDQFLRNNPDAVVFATVPVSQNLYMGRQVTLITGWNGFARSYPGAAIDVFGNGLEEEALKTIDPRGIIFHAGGALTGISHIYWKQHVSAGETLTVQGRYENNSNQKIKLALQAFGSIKDTVVVDAGEKKDFELQTVPLHAGNANYTLLAIAGKDTLQREPVPVEVVQTGGLKLLIIANAPDFENTYLKNYLSRLGYAVTISTLVSTNKTSEQFLNTAVQKSNLLSPGRLSGYDLLLTDAESLQQMGRAAQAAIASAVQSAGTGLLVKMDSAVRTGSFYTKFFRLKTLRQKQSAFTFYSTGSDSNRYTLQIAHPISIESNTGTQALLQDAQSNVFAAAVQYGNGKIIASTLPNTYSMALAGSPDRYQRLWSGLLTSAAKKTFSPAYWLIEPSIAHINNPTRLQVLSNGGILQQAIVDSVLVFFRQNMALPFQYEGLYWPASAGWKTNRLPGGEQYNWYAYRMPDWECLGQFARRQQTLDYARQHLVMIHAQPGTTALMINRPLLMFLLFMGCCIFLWVEQKKG